MQCSKYQASRTQEPGGRSVDDLTLRLVCSVFSIPQYDDNLRTRGSCGPGLHRELLGWILELQAKLGCKRDQETQGHGERCLYQVSRNFYTSLRGDSPMSIKTA